MLVQLHNQQRQRVPGGFSLIEALVVLTIMSIVAVAAAVGLQSGVRGPAAADEILSIDRALVTRMEALKSLASSNWAAVAAQAGTATVTINNKTYTQTTTVTAQAKPDGSGGTASDFVQVVVQVGSRSMTSYLSQP